MRALPALFVVYLVEACAAVALGLPAGLRAVADGPQGKSALATAQWLETAAYWAPTAKTFGVTALIVLGIVCALSPWLQMSWLSALSRSESLGSSLAQGARFWWRASLVTLLVWVGVGLMLAPWLLAGWGIMRALGGPADARAHDLALLACALSALPVLWVGHVWHDLARARALLEGPVRAAARGLRSAWRPRVLLSAACWTLLGWSSIALSQRYAGELAGPLLQVALLQSALLLRLIARSRWLAQALACADQNH